MSSDSAYRDAQTALAQAEADVAAAQAVLDEAQLNLDYTEVRAPIAGTIGRATITEGALVTAQADVMATIQQLDPVYADFTQSVAQVLALRRAMAAGQLVAAAPDEARVHMTYDDGSSYGPAGRLLFSEATVDPSTGQVTLRAEFPNPEGDLLPGLYVRVQIEQATRQDALTIPQMAVQRDGEGAPFVYVLSQDDTAEARPVTLGATMGTRWLVDEGLAAGDRVVVEGAQKLSPGAAAAPEAWQPAQAVRAAVPAQ
ncbi:efflux RND transporter periplasmic adaptor subunit [Mangrovicoccus ximenensis]|uniref:efflux RND transporter periplasmic adaptor subunit n=1 Tax=Mangrovicoccus ximenensis TaxID=1911570 RepID=UPI001F022CB1|nr:efflux RND transporter periplasmic adaptor subunit [Mangrovicoccus ximenensis]